MTVNVKDQSHREINEKLKSLVSESKEKIVLTGCCGQRFIAAGFSDADIEVEGIPGNALGAYLNGAQIKVCGNAQDAVGDTMNDGKIVICGNIGDAAGYAMRGGEIYVRGNAGYRAGIHMKEYKEKRPVLVVGGKCGSFLGEYQAGGIIIVLGLGDEADSKKIVSNFPCTGMHGGKVYLRLPVEEAEKQLVFPKGVTAAKATDADMAEIEGYLREFCRQFGFDAGEIKGSPFTVIVPDSKNPYKQMYVAN